jgi:hypothetical protein
MPVEKNRWKPKLLNVLLPQQLIPESGKTKTKRWQFLISPNSQERASMAGYSHDLEEENV